MHPELKAYLDEFEEKAQARYDASARLFAQHDALLSKILAGVSTPQPVCPMGTAADDGLTDDASVPAVVPDVFSATTQAQEPPAVAHDAPSVCVEMVPITCSTECLTQVASIASVHEVHDAATTAHPEPVVDLIHQEVAAEIVTPVATTTDVGPKTSVQGMDDSPLPSINTSTQVVSEADHIVVLLVPNNLAAPAPSKCLAECPAYVGDWVKPLTATIDSADETHDTAIAERLHLPSFEHQPWPPTVQVQYNHMGHLFRPSPWPSFRPLSVTSHPEEACSSIHSQSHGGPCFSPWLIRLAIRDVPREDPGNGTDSDSTCTNGIQHKVPESVSTIGPLAVAHPTEREDCLEEYQDESSFLHQSDPGDGAAIAHESDVSVELRSLNKGSVGSFGYRDDLAVTVDGMLKSTAEDNCSKCILVKNSTLDFSCEARPEQQENIYNRKSATKVSTNYTVSSGYLLKAPNVSGDLNFLGESLRSLPSVQPHEVRSSELVLLLFGGEAFLQVYCCELSPMEGTFSCFPDAQRQSWCPMDRAMSDAKQSNQAGYSQAVVQEPFIFLLGAQLPSDDTQSQHLSRSHFHAYQNGSSFRMSWDPGNHIMSNLEKPFSSFQGTQLQSRHTPDRTKSGAIKSSREEAIHWEQVHYKGLQFYPYSLEQPLEGDENFIPYQSAYGFNLEMSELVSNMWKSDHGWAVRLYHLQRQYMLLGILCSTHDCSLHVSIKSWFEQQKGRSCNLPYLIFALDGFGYNNKASQQEEISWNSGSSHTGYNFPNHCCGYPCGTAEGLIHRPLHRRILQAVKIFKELISAVTMESYSASNSFVHSGCDHMRTVQHINTGESTKIRSECSVCSGTHPVGIWLLLTEMESYILADSENAAYAGIAWIPHGFASSHQTTHSVHENRYIVSRATTIQWVRRTHIPIFKPKPPWSISVPPSLIPGFRGTKRTNSERAQLAEILWELTQFWANVDHTSARSSYLWGFSGVTRPAARLGSSLPWEFWNTAQSNEQHAVQSVPLATSSCEQWDPGGLDFAEPEENEHRLVLGGKPVVKEEGMSATQIQPSLRRPKALPWQPKPLPWQPNQRQRKPLPLQPKQQAHHATSTWAGLVGRHTRGKPDYKYLHGKQQRTHPGLDQAKATTASSFSYLLMAAYCNGAMSYSNTGGCYGDGKHGHGGRTMSYSNTTDVVKCYGGGEQGQGYYKREDRQHKSGERVGEVGALAAGAFALHAYQEHRQQKQAGYGDVGGAPKQHRGSFASRLCQPASLC